MLSLPIDLALYYTPVENARNCKINVRTFSNVISSHRFITQINLRCRLGSAQMYKLWSVKHMISRVYSTTCYGVTACLIEVEVDISPGLPQTTIVGLPDQAIKESKERVKSAIKNSGFPFSPKKLTINLAPADLKKEGPSFDLAIAIGILASTGHVNPNALNQFLFLGELALDGSLRKVRGALPAATLAKEINRPLIVPFENTDEVSLEKEAHVLCANHLTEVIRFLNGELDLSKAKSRGIKPISTNTVLDFSEVKGQWHAKRAIEIACSGGHNLLFVGPPGAGKTMLASRISTILPPLEDSEAIEISKIYSVAGLFSGGALHHARPFRSPHHTISQIGLVGGGSYPRPGEISLAHGGVLFLDEFPEFHRDVIEALRGPLEEGVILISRAKQNLVFPARFLLVCAMNPCPCGHLTNRKQVCRCSLGQIQRYLNKISGPILDRIDLHVELPTVEYKDLADTTPSESSADIKKRVLRARAVQAKRFQGIKIATNAQMNPREIKKFCGLDSDSKQLLERAMKELSFSARGYFKMIKIARTISDLADSETIESVHIAEALQYRSLDRNYFG